MEVCLYIYLNIKVLRFVYKFIWIIMDWNVMFDFGLFVFYYVGSDSVVYILIFSVFLEKKFFKIL